MRASSVRYAPRSEASLHRDHGEAAPKHGSGAAFFMASPVQFVREPDLGLAPVAAYGALGQTRQVCGLLLRHPTEKLEPDAASRITDAMDSGEQGLA